MQGLLEFAKTLGAPRIAAMAAVTLALVGFFAFLILRVSSPQMTPLFTDISYEDSSAIVKDLERQGIGYELRNDGATIMVPKDTVARLRMSLAGEGLPKGGNVGYEIFDKSDALGTTSFIQNINNLRALEGELARTIKALDRVAAARVHLVLPERPLFSRDKVEPSASIVLKVRGTLEPQQVRAIRHLVASAVNGLKPQRVSIVDEAGRLLADGSGTDDFGGHILRADQKGCGARAVLHFLGARRPRARPLRADDQGRVPGRLQRRGQCSHAGALRAAEIQRTQTTLQTQRNCPDGARLQIRRRGGGRGEIDLGNLRPIPASEALPRSLHGHGHDILVPATVCTPPLREPLQRGCHPRMCRGDDRALEAQAGNVGSPRRDTEPHVRAPLQVAPYAAA